MPRRHPAPELATPWLRSPHTPESGVDVLIVRLEPVTEGAAQHAAGGARRASLENVVAAVEEVGGIAGIRRMRSEAVKRRERTPRPFPPVGQQSLDAEGAAARREGMHGSRIPPREVEISVLRRRRVI